MTPVVPMVVRCPDGTVGVLVGRQGLTAVLRIGDSPILRGIRLDNLDYHMTAPPRTE